MIKFLLFVALSFPFISQATVRPGVIVDRDLTGPWSIRPRAPIPLDLAPDRIEASNDDTPLTIEILRMDHGRALPVSGLTVTQSTASRRYAGKTNPRGMVRLATCSTRGETTVITAPLQDDRLAVTSNGRAVYRIVAQVPCRGLVRLFFDQSTNGGQAVSIWQVASRGKAMLQAEVGLEFWTRPMTFVWPADGDYYSYGTVNITRGDYWDVVGHEMGHAIYDLGDLGAFGGGSHKIDECYSPALALSEGWASYFSAWISVDVRDPDAKFEFMVPRRSPIRFENIPADVCRGPNNEWRVTGFFWDLIDLNVDGEDSGARFKPVWLALYKRNAQNMDQVRSLLLQSGYDANLLSTIWNLNF